MREGKIEQLTFSFDSLILCIRPRLAYNSCKELHVQSHCTELFELDSTGKL